LRLKRGIEPQSMEDRWHIFFKDPWLYFARSWTGFCVYKIRMRMDKPHEIEEAWANRDRRQYRSEGAEKDLALLSMLIDEILLSRRI
jgi:hypothetical protein